MYTRILFDCLIAEGQLRVGFEGDDSRGTATDLLFSEREKERREYAELKSRSLYPSRESSFSISNPLPSAAVKRVFTLLIAYEF
jgi:hypothetical protein